MNLCMGLIHYLTFLFGVNKRVYLTKDEANALCMGTAYIYIVCFLYTPVISVATNLTWATVFVAAVAESPRSLATPGLA